MFGRDGANLTLALPVTFEEAALGADIKVPSFRGEAVKLRLPPAPSPDERSGSRAAASRLLGVGDLLVTVEVAIPTKLSKPQREALKAFAEATADSPRAHLDIRR